MMNRPGPMKRIHRIAHMKNKFLGCLIANCLCAAGITTFAQTLQQGSHFFALENLDTGEITQRGETGSSGIAFNSLTLAPNTKYRIWILQAETLNLGFSDIETPGNGRRIQAPTVVIGTPGVGDSDLDGLSDDAERIMGTNPLIADTDEDGILDGTEVRQGLNPLGESVARTGVVGSVDTDGETRDVDAFNDLVVVADTEEGVMIFNIFNGMIPLVVGQINTPGTAEAVSIGGDTVAVADGEAGLAIVNVADPPNIRLVHQIALGGFVRSVVTDGQMVFAGLDNGSVVAVDLVSGLEVDRIRLPDTARAVEDLRIYGTELYALQETRLSVLRFSEAEISLLGQADSPGGRNNANDRMRLFVGGDVAYVVHRRGYNTIDVSDPAQPAPIRNTSLAQFGWKEVVPNGSGLALVASSPNEAFDGPHNVSLYDVSDPTVTDNLIATFETPGAARSVTIYNGIGYVADHLSGLHIVNYLAVDTARVAPEISIRLPSGATDVESGSRFLVRAEVTDDVQVRNVEFYVDGNLILTDGNFPFETLLPARSQAGQSTLTVQARASDTGGVASFSDPLILNVTPDTTPPRLITMTPAPGSVAGTVSGLTAFFSEAMDLETFTNESFILSGSGPDSIFGTEDDTGFQFRSITENRAGSIINAALSVPLPPDAYRLAVNDGVRDNSGNPLETEFVGGFIVLGASDSDQDGIPDNIEADLGLDPFNPDTDGNGVRDGLEDLDNDSIPNQFEVVLGFDPNLEDSDGDGIPDAAEDRDLDGAADYLEVTVGSGLNVADTDRDGFDDNVEILSGTNPLSPDDRPAIEIKSRLVYFKNVKRNNEIIPANLVLSRPVIFENIPGREFGGPSVISKPVYFENNL